MNKEKRFELNLMSKKVDFEGPKGINQDFSTKSDPT